MLTDAREAVVPLRFAIPVIPSAVIAAVTRIDCPYTAAGGMLRITHGTMNRWLILRSGMATVDVTSKP